MPSSVMRIRVHPAAPGPTCSRPALSHEASHSNTRRRPGAVTELSFMPTSLRMFACCRMPLEVCSTGQPDEALLVLAAQHRSGVLPPHCCQLVPRHPVNLLQLRQPSIQRLSGLLLSELRLACCQLMCSDLLQCITSAS